MDEEGTAVVTAVVVDKDDEPSAQNGVAKNKENKNNAKRKTNTPFQRIKADEITFADERLKDNSFAAKVCVSLEI